MVYFKHGTANKIIPRRIEHSGNPNNVGIYKVRDTRMQFPFGRKVNGVLMYRISEVIADEQKFEQAEKSLNKQENIAVQGLDKQETVIKQSSDRQESVVKQGLDTQDTVAENSLDEEVMIENCQDRHKDTAYIDLDTRETILVEKCQDRQDIMVEDRQEAAALDKCENIYIGIYFKIPLLNSYNKNEYGIKIRIQTGRSTRKIWQK